MTTQDHQTLTGSYDESQTAQSATPQAGEHAAPAQSLDSSDSSSAPPPPAAQEQSQSTASGEAARREESAESAERSQDQREPSAEQTLFANDQLADLRARWAGVQAAFVDDPKACVQKADGLVSDLVEQLTTGFAQARSRLEEQWGRGEDASTEDLRVTLMNYREFFERLLAV
jgi:hypothetical protein